VHLHLLQVPLGFCLCPFARFSPSQPGLNGARGIEVAGNGDVIVIAKSQANVIVALYEDDNGVTQKANLGGNGLNLNHAIRVRLLHVIVVAWADAKCIVDIRWLSLREL